MTAEATGVKVTTTPNAGAAFSSDRPNHTGVVLHVLANRDLIIANQNLDRMRGLVKIMKVL